MSKANRDRKLKAKQLAKDRRDSEYALQQLQVGGQQRGMDEVYEYVRMRIASSSGRPPSMPRMPLQGNTISMIIVDDLIGQTQASAMPICSGIEPHPTQKSVWGTGD